MIRLLPRWDWPRPASGGATGADKPLCNPVSRFRTRTVLAADYCVRFAAAMCKPPDQDGHLRIATLFGVSGGGPGCRYLSVAAYRNLLFFAGVVIHPDVGGNIMLTHSIRGVHFVVGLLAGAAIVASPIFSHAQEHSAAVPLRGTDIGHFTVAATTDPQVVITSDHAVGELTSVGSFTLTAEEHINLQTLQVSQARFTLTARNGDHLTGTYQGTAHLVGIPNVIEYDVAGLISGGSGQFEGMSGAIVFHGSADLEQGTFKDEILGVVTLEK